MTSYDEPTTIAPEAGHAAVERSQQPTRRTLLASLKEGPQFRQLLVLLDLTVVAFGWRLAQLINQQDRVATRTGELLFVGSVRCV